MAPKYGQEPKRARLRLEQRPRSASKGMPARLPPNDPSINTRYEAYGERHSTRPI